MAVEVKRGGDLSQPCDTATVSDTGRSSGSGYRRRPGLTSGSCAGLGVFTPPLVIRGLIAGAIAALTIRQGALFLASLGDLAPPPSIGFKPRPGDLLPDIASLALWGALWGAALAPLLPRRNRGRRYWLTGLLLGATLPTSAVLGLTLAVSGWPPEWLGIAVSLLVEGAWGLGTALALVLL
jgi:hypothetical protein